MVVQAKPLLRAGTIALRRMRVPLFLSKFSRHDFTVHQHLLLLAFRELSHESWRGLHDRLEDSKAAEEILLLSSVPHFTTPQKFLQRIPRRWLLRLLHALVALLTSELRLAVDASAFPLRFASTHYLQRLGQTLEFHHFLKSIDAVDVSTGLVVTTRAVIGNRHEAPYAIPLLRQIPRHFRLRELYADKAFDSEAIYRYLGQRRVATYIPPRGYSTLHGARRLRVAKFQLDHPEEWQHHYGRRARAESTYHALKARVGDRISGRSWPMRTRYHWTKVWAYDLQLFGRQSDTGPYGFVPAIRRGFLHYRWMQTLNGSSGTSCC